MKPTDTQQPPSPPASPPASPPGVPSTPHAGPYLAARAAGEYLGIGESTLWRYLREDPTFPKPYKPSERKTLFAVPELEAWMQTKQVGRTAT